ncbi:MFS transporter [Insolitispirillum peregrinum]|uniref:MFS transporter n=1 Tax=Insolitispirillum peregrinum TaxID=80876 RepID=UPI003617DF0C
MQPAFPPAAQYYERGTPAYRRVSFALFLAGYATFSLLYCVQPMLPAFADHFGVSPAESSLALSLSTGALAIAIFGAAAVSEGFGRRALMGFGVAAAAVLNLLTAVCDNWHLLLVIRALEGFVLGGVPAVAMAYLAEEISPKGLAQAMGLYVTGNAFGGMSGRVITGFIAEYFSWRPALGVLGLIGLLAAIGFWLLLPPSRNFVRRPGFDPLYHAKAWAGHLRNPALLSLFAIGFLSMGAFVTIYNYAGFHLMAAPYNLNQTQIGLMFTVYMFGMASSSLAGSIADRWGRWRVMTVGLVIALSGIMLGSLAGLWSALAGVSLLTFGFFIAHTIASGWVGRLAQHSKGHASSLYLLAYYLGSSIVGSVGGWFWSHGGWGAVVGLTGVMIATALGLAVLLRRLAR